MDRGLALALTAVVGGMVALQAPINSGLGKAVGNFQAAFVSFFVGTIILAVIAALARGGLLGGAYVTTVLVSVRTLGAGAVVAATIAGQLTMSVIIDQFGLLGVDKDPINAMKLIGIVLLGAGTFLVVRG